MSMINDYILAQDVDDIQELICKTIKDLKKCDNKNYYKPQLIFLMNKWTKMIIEEKNIDE